MQRGGQLDAVGAERDREVEPFLDGEIRVRVASLARRQLLERGGQHADRHELRFESLDVGLMVWPSLSEFVVQMSAIATGASVARRLDRGVEHALGLQRVGEVGSGTTGSPPPMTVRMSLAWLTKLCS